jgi:glycosyltransferase involved in cell wall biosynthesis
MLSDYEALGGAARCATRLADGLRVAGHEVVRVVGFPVDGIERDDLRALRLPLVERKLAGVAARVAGEAARRRVHRWRLPSTLQRLIAEVRPHVINVHNLHGAGWDPDLIAACRSAAPVVWTLHDMWSMTGRCAYAYACRAFVSGCGTDCPTPDEYPALAADEIPGSWQRRRELYAAAPDIAVVAPSRWLAEEARSGMWGAHRVETIPYGVPHSIYSPAADRPSLRRRLGLAEDSFVALIVADDIAERRKGFGYVFDALAQRPRTGMSLVLAGRARGLPAIPGVDVHHLGFLGAQSQLAEAYCAADFLLHPAPVDNLPNVVLEAMACGTPTVAFPVGGLPDMVRPGHTGWLASQLSAPALGEAIDGALADLRAGRRLRDSCATVSRAEYTLDRQARRYGELFDDLATS